MAALKEFLVNLKIEQYYDELVDDGFDDLDFLKTRSEEQLKIIANDVDMKTGHQMKFIEALLDKNTVYPPLPTTTSDTYIGIVVDRSGSMSSIVNDVIGGYNTFINEQKKLGNAKVSVVRFDDRVEVIHDNVDIHTIPDATVDTFAPRGSTALLDSIKYTVDLANKYINSQINKPSKVMIVILTDGEENSSRECTRKDIFEIIREHEDKFNWEFIFLAANQDAIKTGSDMGMKATNCMDFSNEKTPQVFRSVTEYAKRMRSDNKRGFTDKERVDCI